MKNNAFTLVELLAVIVIIGVVSLIAIPSVMNSLAKAKDRAYAVQKSEIITAAKKWGSNNIDKLDEYHLNNTYITLTVLKQEEYLENDDIKNPSNNEIMVGCIEISYSFDTNSYGYNYIETSGQEEKACDGKMGYIYTYDNDTFVANKDNAKKSAYDIILENETNKGIKVIGQTESGLYDINDEYVFRGSDVSNYVKLGNEIWRIISINKKDKTIRLIKNSAIKSSVWDGTGIIKFENATSKTEILDGLFESTSSSIISKLGDKVKKDTVLNVGSIDSIDSSYDVLKSKETTETIQHKAGMINISDYIMADINGNNYINDMIKTTSMWTLNSNGIDGIWYIKTDGSILTSASNNEVGYGIYPVITLNSNVTITGDENGTSNTPYIIEIDET